MKYLKKRQAKYVKAIRKIRERNNLLWMDVLGIALNCAPIRTRKVLKEIHRNDMEISGLTGKIANDED